MSSLLIALMAPQGGGDAGGGMISTVVMFALIIFIFYFMIIRPQSKRQKERQKMLDAMKKGDKVVTNGGIHGRIVGMEDKTVLLEIAENIKIKVEKSAIGTILPE
ncbi:MAG: preprotein translocase subunit YajC [Bacteroidetes bacterium]|nr:preprotein translocase subunit YajC [Bacteroidota bacterium]